MLVAVTNLTYSRHASENWVIAKGDITNSSNKNYSTAVYRAHLYGNSEQLSSAVIRLHGFRAGSTRQFEAVFEGFPSEMTSRITKMEVFFESSY